MTDATTPSNETPVDTLANAVLPTPLQDHDTIDDSTLDAAVVPGAAPAPAAPAVPAGAAAAPEANKEETNLATPMLAEPVVKSQNVKLTTSPFAAAPKFDDRAEIMQLPAGYDKQIEVRVNNIKQNQVPDNEATREWANAIGEGSQLVSFEEAYLPTLEDPDALFVQEVEHTTGPLRPSFPSFANANPGESLTGSRAALRLSSHLGLGSIFRLPLWNSGIWVNIQPPGEAELLELNRLMISDKIQFGRQSYGLAFSNLSAVTADRMVDICLNNLFSTSAQKDVELRQVLSCQDIPTLIWGLANAVYPNGFQYERSCTHDVAKCQHVVKERLNLSKICWVNSKSFTQMQLAHMGGKRASDSMDTKSIVDYQTQMLQAQKREITLESTNGQELKLTLRVPTIAQYVESGYRWISDITGIVNKALGTEATDNERNNFMVQNGQVSAMRQYVHWVDHMSYGGVVVQDVDTYERLFTILSQDDKIRDDFMDKMKQYVDDTQTTVIGIPTYDCPACGNEQKVEPVLAGMTNIIPLDAYQTFFTLLGQRLARIRTR